MSFLSRMFNYVPAKERKGIHLDEKNCWVVSGVKSLSDFLRAIYYLVPMGSVLYLEDGNTPTKLRSFLEQRNARNISKVEMGTIWPRPECFHIEITKENIEGLAEFAENYAECEVAIHLHVYKDGKMLLQWYDAFFDPLLVSVEIPEEKIQAFCDKLKANFKKSDDKEKQAGK
jgi:hypothetical protein